MGGFKGSILSVVGSDSQIQKFHSLVPPSLSSSTDPTRLCLLANLKWSVHSLALLGSESPAQRSRRRRERGRGRKKPRKEWLALTATANGGVGGRERERRGLQKSARLGSNSNRTLCELRGPNNIFRTKLFQVPARPTYRYGWTQHKHATFDARNFDARFEGALLANSTSTSTAIYWQTSEQLIMVHGQQRRRDVVARATRVFASSRNT